MKKESMIWYDRKRLWCGLPWTFTKYGMDEGRLFVETGFCHVAQAGLELLNSSNPQFEQKYYPEDFRTGYDSH